MTTPREEVLFEAAFDPKWKTYFLLRILALMVVTIIGIFLVPFWLLGWGQWYGKRYYDTLKCTLCERSLVIGRGIFFRKERTIPLDKIQDLTLLEGPSVVGRNRRTEHVSRGVGSQSRGHRRRPGVSRSRPRSARSRHRSGDSDRSGSAGRFDG